MHRDDKCCQCTGKRESTEERSSELNLLHRLGSVLDTNASSGSYTQSLIPNLDL